MKYDLKISPYGGVGEIGSNMTVFETNEHVVVIDYGILFPYDDFFDINYLIVDTKNLPKDKPITLFVTHGHEDHIGAIHHFIQDFPQVKIYAPRFAAELLRGKFERYKTQFPVEIYDENFVLSFDQFELHPVHVTHSIPDTYGLIFKDIAGEFASLFISDFKYDLNPLYEDAFNTQKIIDHFSSAKMRLAMLDSTNILHNKKTVSERELTPAFNEILQEQGRVFITLFSSNIFRLKNILDVAKAQNRVVVTVGRSIQSYLDSANTTGLIDIADYTIRDIDSIQNHASPNIVYLLTGCQGEHLGATRRVVTGEHKYLKICESDRFVFSSKPIPGNEKKIYRLYNLISQVGAKIITNSDMLIHASGHPSKVDLKSLVEKINPTHYIPIHGEVLFLRKHVQFINECFPHIDAQFLTNFTDILIHIADKKFSFSPQEELTPKLIHGSAVEIPREKVSQRRKLACNGGVFISLNSKRSLSSITINGVPNLDDEQMDSLKELISYQAFSKLKGRDSEYIAEEVRIKARNFFKNLFGYKPITIVHFL